MWAITILLICGAMSCIKGAKEPATDDAARSALVARIDAYYDAFKHHRIRKALKLWVPGAAEDETAENIKDDEEMARHMTGLSWKTVTIERSGDVARVVMEITMSQKDEETGKEQTITDRSTDYWKLVAGEWYFVPGGGEDEWAGAQAHQ